MAEHFFVVGAQRCGTTYLYRLLEQHPEIAMARPLRPEPKHFLVADPGDDSLDHYEATYFAHATEQQVRGEKSAGYLESPEAAARIHSLLPRGRIVVVVREPVARAVSNYRFSVESGIERLPVDEALVADPHSRVERSGPWFVVDGRRIASNPFLYLERGRYTDHLSVYAALFGRDRVHVAVFEDLIRSAEPVRRVYSFLGVDDGYRPSRPPRPVNPSTVPEPVLHPSTLRHLRAAFQDSNERLATEYDLDLSAWSGG